MKDALPPTVRCTCGGNRRERSAPLRVYSTFSAWMRTQVYIGPDTRVGTWKCSCGRVYQLTAGSLGFTKA
jgi:hypothetical protein